MIISHQHKFIFIKPQKTAGTSVELLLSRFCGENDIITPLGHDPNPNVREIHHAKNPQNFYRKKPLKQWKISELYYFLKKGIKPNLNYWEHIQADRIKKYVGDDIWQSYTKISIVRNPWDHAVSWFKWQEKYGYEGTKKGEFERYLIKNYRSTWGHYSVDYGLYDIDFMIRFENLNQDIQQLFNRLELPLKYELPKTKHNLRETKEYKSFYPKKYMIDIVYEKSFNIIHKFEYDY